MGFALSIQTSYIEVYSFSGDENFDDEDLKDLAEKCAVVCPRNEQEIEDLVFELRNKEVAEPVLGGLALDPCEPIKVSVKGQEDFEIEGMEDVEMPEASQIVPDEVSSKFCYLKVWENGGTFEYEDDGDFDENLISYKNGKLLYDGNEFQLVDGEGSSSYQEFYRDGECVYRGG
jgi:hypothetical protein